MGNAFPYWLCLTLSAGSIVLGGVGMTLRFLFLAARIWRHAGRVGVSYSDHYQEKGAFQKLMDRLRKVARGPDGFAPVLSAPLRA